MNSLEYHRLELEGRIRRFDGECDQAIKSITKLKIHARSFLETMACDLTELKDRFLWCTRQLDEFMYLVTEFNLSVSKFAAEDNEWPKTNTSKGPVPVTKNGQSETTIPSAHNMSAQKLESSNTEFAYPAKEPYQAIKHSIEPSQTRQGLLSIHKTEQGNWRESQIITHQGKLNSKEPNVQTGRASRRKKTPHTSTKTSKDLMQFSSVSCSAESFVGDNEVKELTQNVNDEETCVPGLALPPQSNLDAAAVSACIASADAANLWLVTDMKGLSKLTNEMTEYYKGYQAPPEEVPGFSCCAYFDEETKSYFRAIYIRTEGVAEVFLADTGECRPPTGRLWPLASRFCNIPPLAHCCHLADVDLPDDEQLAEKQATLLSKHLWEEYRIELHTADNNSSESQGVYVYLDNGTTLNELLRKELASSKSQPEPHIANGLTNEEPDRQVQGSRQDLDSIDLDEELKDEFEYGPEHENPLEAVTGYSNRDEVDICKHYAGGPERACFKGARCKKRHVLQHPDGWTLDRVPVVASCRPAKLPAPGTLCKVKVTHVRDVGCFFVQFEPKDEIMTLADLVEDMNRHAANDKPLKMLPALGELVSARFSDGRWYRARVTSCDDEHGTVEVTYIDYGNESTVKLTALSPLEPRWLALPVAAARCRLAGVAAAGHAAARAFREMVLELALQARVIARSYDELTLELFDLEGFKVSDQLAVMADVPLQPYEVEDDSHRISLHVPA